MAHQGSISQSMTSEMGKSNLDDKHVCGSSELSTAGMPSNGCSEREFETGYDVEEVSLHIGMSGWVREREIAVRCPLSGAGHLFFPTSHANRPIGNQPEPFIIMSVRSRKRKRKRRRWSWVGEEETRGTDP